MRSRSSKLVYLLSLVLSAVILIAGCTSAATSVVPTNRAKPAAPAAAPPPTQAATETQPPAPPPATATSLPTVTAQATATANLTAATPAAETATTPQAGEPLNQPLAAWCLPLDAAVSNAKDPLQPPANAKKAAYHDSILELRRLPSNGCVFLYTFDKAVPAGLKLEIYELKGTRPFFSIDLLPISGKEQTVWAFIRHTMIVAPPKASLSFSLVVRDPLGQVLQRDQVNIHSWVAPPTGVPSSDNSDCGCSVTPPVIPTDEP